MRVLSTVKATMMGQNMESEEDQEAMDMLVFNAQKLNQVRSTQSIQNKYMVYYRALRSILAKLLLWRCSYI